MNICKVLFTLALLLTSSTYYAGVTQHAPTQVQSVAAQEIEKEAVQHGTPLESVLNADGTLNLNASFKGSLDPTGWEMMEGEGGEPRFTKANGAQAAQASPAHGDDNWDDRFGLRGVSFTVHAIAIFGGDVYVGGEFSGTSDTAANYIARWDGSLWHNLGTGLDHYVYAIAVSGTDVYAGGSFTAAGGVSANRIAKWDGVQWSPLGSGMDDTVRSIAIGTDGVYAGGEFTLAGGKSANHIGLWNGNEWQPLGSGTDGTVYALAENAAGLYVAGGFLMAGGVYVAHIALWDGTNWLTLGSGIGGSVLALAVAGNDLYVGGFFSQAGAIQANNIARWDGSQWFALGLGTNNPVHTITLIGSDVYAGGEFTQAGDVSAKYIAKWDGALWSEVSGGVDRRIEASGAIGGSLYVGGYFLIAGNDSLVAHRIAMWDGSQWSLLGSATSKGLSGFISTVAVNGSDVYVGGRFRTAGGIQVNNIARWDGNEWSALGSGIGGTSSSDAVYDIAVHGDNLYAAGYFSSAGGIPAMNIARWSGNEWSALGDGLDYRVWGVVANDNYVYAGGHFGWSGNVNVRHIARWDGSTWSALGSGLGSWSGGDFVYDIALSGPYVYAGGRFDTAGSTIVNNIAVWDGYEWSPLGKGANGGVYSIAIAGEDVYAGGYFTMTSGVSANNIARWNGTEWSALGSGVNGSVDTLTIIGNDLYAGGSFDTAGDISANAIARWNGGQWYPLGSGLLGGGLTNKVFSLGVDSDKVYVGGSFTEAGEKSSGFFGMWHATCLSNFSDVPPDNTFHPYIRCLVCQGIIGGYDDGTFRPGNPVTRGQLSKIISNAAGFSDPPGEQLFEDVVPGSTFYDWVQRLANQGHIGGYPCGGESEPCVPPLNRPYFRPNANATRGQISKIVANAASFNDPPGEQRFEDVPPGSAFYDWVQRLAIHGVMGGYPCGGPGEDCLPPDNRPYFRPTLDATRGQLSKITANSFFPNCNPQEGAFQR